jgi:hypothetical protein
MSTDGLADSETWEDLDIHEIVEQICTRHGWKTHVEPTETVWSNDGATDGVLKKKSFTRMGLTDFQFIRDVLAPEARRITDGMMDYMVRMDDRDSTLHFHPIDPAEVGSPIEYRFMRDRMGEVLSFTPKISALIRDRQGAGRTATPYINHQTGEVGVAYSNNDSTQSKPVIGGKFTFARPTPTDPLDESASVVSHKPVRDADQALAESEEKYTAPWFLTLGGKLQIMGDPLLEAMKVVRIKVEHPDGTLDETSGLYFVSGVSDVIDFSSGFTTTLDLARQGYNPKSVPPEAQKAQGTVYE